MKPGCDTCHRANCEFRRPDTWCHRFDPIRFPLESDPRVVALIATARAAERENCLRIVESEVLKALSDERAKMSRAKSDGRETAELIFGHGAWAFDELGTAIYHAINGASMEDPIEEERARCAKICADRAERLRATAEQYPAGTAACFAEEARECERLIRGGE